MVGYTLASVVHVDTAGVLLNAVSINVSRHRSTSIDLSHDLVVTLGRAILVNSDKRVIIDLVTVVSAVVTVHAHVDGRALHVLGLVLLASQVGNTVSCHPSIGSIGVTTIAGTSITAVDQSLNGRNDVALLALGLDLETVGNRGEGRMSPAGATVHRDVLVEVHGQQSSVAVVQRFGEVILAEVLVGSLAQHALANSGRILEDEFLLVVCLHSDGGGKDQSDGVLHGC
mmetsp:Transcript_14246/g.26663  ORF Transcript_14246/g.26663 Transcript_14246/m.26663 type:complete len:228 (-) Transcript_14246:57-740(-)